MIKIIKKDFKKIVLKEGFRQNEHLLMTSLTHKK